MFTSAIKSQLTEAMDEASASLHCMLNDVAVSQSSIQIDLSQLRAAIQAIDVMTLEEAMEELEKMFPPSVYIHVSYDLYKNQSMTRGAKYEACYVLCVNSRIWMRDSKTKQNFTTLESLVASVRRDLAEEHITPAALVA